MNVCVETALKCLAAALSSGADVDGDNRTNIVTAIHEADGRGSRFALRHAGRAAAKKVVQVEVLKGDHAPCSDCSLANTTVLV